MKSKWYLIASIFELIIGIVAVVAFVILGLNDENMIKWIKQQIRIWASFVTKNILIDV